MKASTMAIIGALVLTGGRPAWAQTTNCQIDPSSWCAHAPADMGYPDTLCSSSQFQNTYQFASPRVCETVLQKARQIRQDWCSCAPEPLQSAYKRDCMTYARAGQPDGEFCAGLPPRTSAISTPITPCHVDQGYWCQNPPADLGWPDSLCATTPNLTTPMADTSTCLAVTAQARNILQQWCSCTYQPDPNSALQPGCFFYQQTNGFKVPICVQLAPRNATEQQAELQRQAKQHLAICESIKRYPANWTLGKNGMTREQYYAACVANGQAELNAAQRPPVSPPSPLPTPGS